MEEVRDTVGLFRHPLGQVNGDGLVHLIDLTVALAQGGREPRCRPHKRGCCRETG